MIYTDEKYEVVTTHIKNLRRNNKSWDEIKYALQTNEEGLIGFLNRKKMVDFWDDSIDKDDWYQIVERIKKIEERSVTNAIFESTVLDNGELIKEKYAPNQRTNAWFHYKKNLTHEYGFSDQVIEEMERTTTRILNRLKEKTEPEKPNKGLIIGNVQSGKTANIVALMTMAADWGWNFFIILSGTIDNLRIQTKDRLRKDLPKGEATIEWSLLDQLDPRKGNQLQDLNLEPRDRSRYYTVVLKNPSRLKKLVKWLNSDQNKRKQLKVLIIDDEADQAGINTASITKNELSVINKSIKQIVYSKNHLGNKSKTNYQAMNYIGYTATPYANVLNESPDDDENLFPEDFVATLKPSNEYFGPQQFFGYEDIDPLNFVNTIPPEDIKTVSLIHKGESDLLPQSLKDAIAWFYICVAIMRYKGYKKPLSMLIHTSQKVDTHKRISKAVEKYIRKSSKEDLMQSFKNVFDIQKQRISISDFNELFPEYPVGNINPIPKFEEIKNEIDILISDEMTNITINEEGELKYSKRVHLCIDNSSKETFKLDENAHVRLKYPNKDDELDYASAFIVVGGATLSRGLTIEGLVSSYFFRTVTQADTLMQMARWFGYRRGYELLPRVWMSKITQERFKFLSELDAELRGTMHTMEVNNIRPSKFGIKVKNSPKTAFMRITAKNKMQSALTIDVDYTGTQYQTTNFINDIEVINNNLSVTEKLITYMNHNHRVELKSNSSIWRNVDYKEVFNYLEVLQVPENKLSVDLRELKEWYQEKYDENLISNWNVVFAGVKDGNEYQFGTHKVYTVNRSKFKDSEDGLIRIGALRAPNDLIIDINKNDIPDESLDYYDNFKIKNIHILRSVAGLNRNPLLIIYLIDKDSEPQVSNNKNRVKLDAKNHLVGTFIYIPTGDQEAIYSSNLRVRLDKEYEEEEEVDEITS